MEHDFVLHCAVMNSDSDVKVFSSKILDGEYEIFS
jgi:hypothetical protein